VLYALLGRLVWFAARRLLRRRLGRLPLPRLGRPRLPRPLLLGGLVLPAALALARQLRRRRV